MDILNRKYSAPIVRVIEVTVDDGFKLSANGLSHISNSSLEHMSWNGETHYGNDFN